MDRIDHPDRIFQLWAFTVGMGRLLLRSTKSEGFDTRIEVVFQNVQALQLPTVLPGLVISTADAMEALRITEATGLLPDDDRRFFVLSGSGYSGYVVAGVMVTCEDEGEYFEPSAVWPA